MATYTPARDRLLALPDAFRLGDVERVIGCTRQRASRHASDWKRAGLVTALGQRDPVFLNAVACPRLLPWERGILMLHPEAVVVGIEALGRAHWLAQLPDRVEVAVRGTGEPQAMGIYDLVPRNAAWFKRTEPARERARAANVFHHEHRLPALPPGWPLLDALRERGWDGCGFLPTDVHPQIIGPTDWDDVHAARRAFRMGLHVPYKGQRT